MGREVPSTWRLVQKQGHIPPPCSQVPRPTANSHRGATSKPWSSSPALPCPALGPAGLRVHSSPCSRRGAQLWTRPAPSPRREAPTARSTGFVIKTTRLRGLALTLTRCGTPGTRCLSLGLNHLEVQMGQFEYRLQEGNETTRWETEQGSGAWGEPSRRYTAAGRPRGWSWLEKPATVPPPTKPLACAQSFQALPRPEGVSFADRAGR